ncbi:hypothetical protein BASA81_000092 [Batrachochytrium salamandrivorans]|nr:hypothetical protein BASA81_000092 [Batrachochytrium salamandrivorans]
MRLARSGSSNGRRASSFTTNQADVRSKRTRVVVVGDGGAGKTSILSSFANGTFPDEYVPTVFENHDLQVEVDGETVELEVWDTAGQEEYSSLRQKSYSNVDVFVLVFAISNRDSFENLFSKWFKEIKQFCPLAGVVVVGAKSDLREDDGVLAEAASYGKPILEYAEYEHRATELAEKYLECSALQREHLDELFQEVVRVDRRMKLSQIDLPNSSATTTMPQSRAQRSKSVVSQARASCIVC